jgi:hypothetical protein
MINSLRRNLVSKAVLALDLFLWLWWLAVMLRIYAIPMLLERIAGKRKEAESPIDVDAVVGLVTHVCNLRPFRSRIFPKLCLRQSLALYRTLIKMGYPIEIHFGVRKDENNLTGHCWVTMEGKPVADTAYSATFKVLYSYSRCRDFDTSQNERIPS